MEKNSEVYGRQLTETIARSVAPSENLTKFHPPTKVTVYMKMNMVPLMPELEEQPAPPKKHLKPNDQLI